MGKKIIKVDLNFPPKEDNDQVDHQTTPIENDYEEVAEEVKEEVKEEAIIEAPKPKRKAAAKKPKEEAVNEVVAEIVEEETKPEITQTDTQKVKCQHCDKEMTMKSLKYSHSRNCLGLKKTIEKVSNEKVSQKTEP